MKEEDAIIGKMKVIFIEAGTPIVMHSRKIYELLGWYYTAIWRHSNIPITCTMVKTVRTENLASTNKLNQKRCEILEQGWATFL